MRPPYGLSVALAVGSLVPVVAVMLGAPVALLGLAAFDIIAAVMVAGVDA